MGVTRHAGGGPERTEKRSVITTLMLGLLFVGWVGEWPLELDQVMYTGLWRSPFVIFGPLFAPIPGIRLFPWQILLIMLLPFCLGTSAAGRQHAREMDRAILISAGCMAAAFLWGWARGGSPYFAYYQVWRFLAALLIAYMLMSLLRTERDLVALGKIVVLAALIRATLCIYFYWAYLHDRAIPLPNGYVTNHDDSMLFVVAIFIIGIWTFLKRERTGRALAVVTVLFLLYAMALNNRRLAWVEMGMAAPLIYLLIGAGPVRSRINRWIMIAAPVVLVYVAAGLGSDSAMFAPVHALTTTGSNLDPSSLTRKEEIRNLLRTLVDTGNPVFGTGWGVPYVKTESIWSNFDPKWVLYLYTPHNSLLALAVYAGLVGVIGIWVVVPVGAYLATRGCIGSSDPIAKTAGMVALCTLAAYSAHCYGDIGFQAFQVSLVFGAALGAAGKVAVWSAAPSAAKTAVATRVAGKGVVLRPHPAHGELRVPRLRIGSTPQRPESPAGNDRTAKRNRGPARRLPR